jgi:hypothetical protein
VSTWWLSFVDPELPRGRRNLGVALVEGENILAAIPEAHRLGCNPGGEVLGFLVPEDVDVRIGPQWRNRLLTSSEAETVKNRYAPS